MVDKNLKLWQYMVIMVMDVHESTGAKHDKSRAGLERLHGMFPTLEDWDTLQGGRPRVFSHQTRHWLVVHVYEQHRDPLQRFQNGRIVETLPPEPTDSLSIKGILRPNEHGRLRERDIIIPSFMDSMVHGLSCEGRSARQGGEAYEVIKDQATYEAFLGNVAFNGYQEWRFTWQKHGFQGVESQIAPVIPLATSV
jgi:hypothetical protein